MFSIGDKVKIIEPFSRYFGEETEIAVVCGIRRTYYHLKIDGEEGDWNESQLVKIYTKDFSSLDIKI